MRIKLTLLPPLVNLILLVCAAAQSPSSDQDKVKAFLDQVNRPVVYSIPAMDQAKVKRDIAYKKDASADFLRMDLYLPANTKGLLPVVILIHGGVYSDVPLKPKDWGFYKSWGRLIAASGMAAVTFNQRLGFPDPNLEQASQDVEDLIGFVRAHSGDWGLDRDRICLAAYSAGGPMLSMATRDAPPYIRCLVGFYPFLDREDFLRRVTATQASFWAMCSKGNTDFTSKAHPRLFYRLAMFSTSLQGVFTCPRAVRVQSDLPEFSPSRLTKRERSW